MKISPALITHKATYPTLAALSAGAVMLVESACQQQSKQHIGGKFPMAIGNTTTGDTTAAPKKHPGKAGTKLKQTPQMVIGKAQIEPQTGDILPPKKTCDSVIPIRKVEEQQPRGRYLIDDITHKRTKNNSSEN